MPADKLIFAKSENARNAITTAEAKRIQKLYEEWANEVGELATYYNRKTTDSSFVTEQQLKSLKKKLTETGKEISGKVNTEIKNSIYQVSSAVVDDNIAWLASLGFDQGALNAAFSSVPKQIVNRLLTGQIYESGWSLSKAIWSSNEQAMKDIYQTIAGGIAQNESVYEIAKKIEAYVDPSKRRPWNLTAPDGTRIYPRRVDYNAQRLVRTLVQHGYQQSFIETTKDNPFITEYIWVSNGSRVCPICGARDGARYTKNNLPMDHPNGMCTMVPDVAKDMSKRLEEWFKADEGTYPDIDNFAKQLGYRGQTPGIKSIPTAAPKAKVKTTITDDDIRSSAKRFKKLGFDKAAEDKFVAALSGKSEEFKKVFLNGVNKKVGSFAKSDSNSYFALKERKKVFLDAASSKAWSSNSYMKKDMLFHEIGHAIDVYSNKFRYSSIKRLNFKESMMKDLKAMEANARKSAKVLDDMGYESTQFIEDLKYDFDEYFTHGVQDIISAMNSKGINMPYLPGKVRPNYAHSKEYWDRSDSQKEAASELFAHMFGAQVDEKYSTYMKQMFPNAYEAFENIVKEIASGL